MENNSLTAHGSELTKEQLLAAFDIFSGCCYPLWKWNFNPELELIGTDCPHGGIFLPLFHLPESKELLLSQTNDRPVLYTLKTIFSWICQPVIEQNLVRAYRILGPYFIGFKDDDICREISSLLAADASPADIHRAVYAAPMITASSAIQWTILQYYSLYEEKLAAEELLYRTVHVRTIEKRKKVTGNITSDQFDNSTGFWKLEQDILNKVEEGDLHNIEELLAMMHTRISASKQGTDKKKIEHARQDVLRLLVLVSRAAINGGMVRKTSHSLSSRYSEMINDCNSISELSELSDAILLDFVKRVHNSKDTLACSGKIRLCCEYIDSHPEEKIGLEQLAQKSGYSTSHLCRKFKEETGILLTDYIRTVKIKRAMHLLVSTERSIEDISHDLAFSSRNYFTSVFEKYTGETPSTYRQKHAIV